MTQVATPLTPLIGHEPKWVALRRAFARNQVPQTLLITGPAHVGKWTLARRYAQLLMCPNVATSEEGATSDDSALPLPCGTCRVCHQIEIETFPDFRIYRPTISSSNATAAPEDLDSSGIYIEQARSFFDEALYRPTVGARKVMVLMQADRMNPQSQNALLKTFEEPVRGITLLLLTDSPDKLLPTVRSRCWELRLGLAPNEPIQEWVQQQFPQLDKASLEEAIRVASGRTGMAWREANRIATAIEEGTSWTPRFKQVMEIVERIRTSSPVAALALTEAALQMADAWGEEDRTNSVLLEGGSPNSADAKKVARILVRSQIAKFLDELANAYSVRWRESLQVSSIAHSAKPETTTVWSDGLDQIRKTRHYILRNANTNLALDVLFGRLIAQQRSAQPAQRSLRSI